MYNFYLKTACNIKFSVIFKSDEISWKYFSMWRRLGVQEEWIIDRIIAKYTDMAGLLYIFYNQLIIIITMNVICIAHITNTKKVLFKVLH